MAYQGFQRGGCLRSGPIRKVGGGHSASGPIPLPLSEIMPLFGTQKIPTYVLPRYTSHARANEHAGKG